MEIGIPTAEYVLPFFVEDASTDLQQKVRSSLRPLHLLLFGHAPTYHLVDCRLHEASADPLTVAVALAVVRNRTAIAFDVSAEFLNRFKQFPRGLLLALERCALQIHFYELQMSESLEHVAVLQIPLDALEGIQHLRAQRLLVFLFSDRLRQAFGGLSQDCQSHGYVEPVEQMLGLRIQV